MVAKQRRASDGDHLWHRIKIAFSRHGAVGAAIVTVPFWMPYVEEYFTGSMLDKLSLMLRSEIHYAHAESNRVDDAVLLQMVRLAVAEQSIHKVEYIKDLIEDKDLRDEKTRRRIRDDIRNELTRQSATYVTFLNNFTSPRIGKVGTHIANTFPMPEFLKNINALVLDNGADRHVIADDVMRFMLHTQEQFFNKMWHEMKRQK